MKRALAVLLCMSVIASGCATAGPSRMSMSTGFQASPPLLPDRELMIAYLKQLPAGSKVRASLTDGSTLHGTLMKATDQEIVIQPRTRIPELPRDVPMDRIRAVELESGGTGVGKAVAIGVAVGVGTFFGVLMLLAAVYGD